MKNIILISLFYFIGCTISSAQCDNKVSTDYNETPTNNALPTNSPQPDYGNKFLNEFNWLPKSVNQTLAKYQTVGLSTGLLDAGEIQNIYSNQQDQYYSYLFNDLEPSPHKIRY